MPNYIVNKNAQANGDHEVHETTCAHGPDFWNRQDLGWHADCKSAVRAARVYYSQSNGCYYCSKPCHTS
ncbi:hypothetical protein DVH29_02860 [Pelagibacterium lacus]|uniref:Uncharacterized protein n=1 Tax=Pelagibacterium lacus TaxID=2282655 RepID=A0A369W7N0_9HYPH|nr:hypothetical protein DVH29_02860 [Pelagibacterium lacus]